MSDEGVQIKIFFQHSQFRKNSGAGKSLEDSAKNTL